MVATSFRRPHRPRDENIRAIFKYAGLNLPGCFLNFAYLKFSSKHDGNMQEMMRMKVVTLTLGHLLVVIRRQEPCILLMQFYLHSVLFTGRMMLVMPVWCRMMLVIPVRFLLLLWSQRRITRQKWPHPTAQRVQAIYM